MPLPGFTLRTPEDEHDRKLLSDIEKYGWHVVHVNEDPQGPSFSFSVGFYYNFQQPEILVMGLRQEVAYEFLKIAYVRAAAGLSFEPYQRNSSFAQGYDCAFAPIEVEHYRDLLGYAVWFYRSLSKPFPAMQLVWPDKQGRFPWEENYDTRFFKLQKALYAR
jgi:hypothetical protein